MKRYVRYVKLRFRNFDPVSLARETERIVCNRENRKYTGFVSDPEYQAIVTGYTAGCCLRCVFCSADWSRDYPEKCGHFYSPKEVFEKLSDIAKKFGLKRLRISGAEPTIGREHLLELLEHVENSRFRIFVLETNGILFGSDKEYVQAISKFRKVHVRVSLKAGTPHEFARRTGAIPGSFNIPFQAIRNLSELGVSFNVAAVTDPRLMSRWERNALLKKLSGIDRKALLNLEDEVILPYRTTLARLRSAGFNWRRYLLPFQLMEVIKRHNRAFRNVCYTLERFENRNAN